MMCGCGWVVFFSCKLTLRLGWMFCLNPEFGFGFTLLGTNIFIHIPPQDAFKLMFFSGFAILVGYIHSGKV